MDEKLKADLEAHREARKTALKKRNAQPGVRKGQLHKHYTDKQKLTALQAYKLTGSYVIASKESGIEYNYLRQLGLTQWWKDSLAELKREEDDILDADLSGIVNLGVSEIKDRLKNGDWMWNSKENKFVRKPVKATEVAQITDRFLNQRNVLRGKPTSISGNLNVSDRLAKLAMEFEKFQKGRTIEAKTSEVIDVEFTDGNETELQEGIPELPREAGTDQEPSGAERSSEDDGEGGSGT